MTVRPLAEVVRYFGVLLLLLRVSKVSYLLTYVLTYLMRRKVSAGFVPVPAKRAAGSP